MPFSLLIGSDSPRSKIGVAAENRSEAVELLFVEIYIPNL